MPRTWLLLLSIAAACGGASDGTTAPAAIEPPDEPLVGESGTPAPAPVSASPPVSPEQEEALLMLAASAYVAKNVAKELEYSIELKAREGDFALLAVQPAAPDQDIALVFMMKDTGGAWTGLDLGTGIECADHVGKGMPQSLCDAAGL